MQYLYWENCQSDWCDLHYMWSLLVENILKQKTV